METIKRYELVFDEISRCKNDKCKGRNKTYKPESAYIGKKYDKKKPKILFIGINPKFSRAHPYIKYLDLEKKHKTYRIYRELYADSFKEWGKNVQPLPTFIRKFYDGINWTDPFPTSVKKFKEGLKSKRENSIWLEYISFVNFVKCARDIMKKGKNFTPPTREMKELCPKKYLEEELKILKPNVIILMGREVREHFYKIIPKKSEILKRTQVIESHHSSYHKDKEIFENCGKVRKYLKKN